MSMNRRNFVGFGLAAVTAGLPDAAQATGAAPANADQYYSPDVTDGDYAYRGTNMQKINDKFRRQLVKFKHNEPPGVIYVDSHNHFVYVTFENNTALRYGCGVGREGFQWYGRARVGNKKVWPDWTPPAAMLLRRPELPRHMDPGPDNPLGPRAMYLFRDGKDLQYRMHGTTEPWSIGGDVSSGCIRLLNEDVVDLFQRTPVGTDVVVLKHFTS